MLFPDPSPPLRVTLLAGPNRALRGPIVEQLIADLSPQPVTVLSFDAGRCTIERNSRVHFRRAESKRINIAQPGLVVPFRADLFIELQAIARERSADHVVVELDSNDERILAVRECAFLAHAPSIQSVFWSL